VTVTDRDHRRLCAALAELLSYPPPGGVAELARAAAELGPWATDGAEALARFRAHVEATPPDALQELYTTTFDLQPACAPYFGHQLLGEESPLRGPLLARLSEIYARDGFSPREELPDHVAEVLRFLAAAPASPERDDLLRDGLLPALARMLETFQDRTNPYRDLLAAAQEALGGGPADALRAPVPARPAEVRP
jgi:nitrate reductase molybdenum cofactor assembly chaperone NarJ/NarW